MHITVLREACYEAGDRVRDTMARYEMGRADRSELVDEINVRRSLWNLFLGELRG